ncbi:splicing factor, Prp19-binding domain-containing protein [Crucibulum laeve]|uniref:Splicing factor, Prp19-binding domain-containing protein n=1 Tax=Crucibulum laeve TaxID=68775 RepID=A0A5C3M648_9AGAR|nr:splicing factor, Prp19-binding domain-containing protein [Crucibulum laeve]
MSTGRKQAPRMSRPAARYWKGKAPKGAAEVESDSEAEDEAYNQQEEGDVLIEGNQDIIQEDDHDHDDLQVRRDISKAKSMNIALKDVNISREGKVIVGGREESGRTALEDEESSEESESEEKADIAGKGEESDESSEYELESEDEKPKLQFRPVFVPKRARATIAEKDAIAQDTEEALKKKELEAEERRKQSHDLVAESIRRELAEKEKEEIIPDVDDTDGIDPAAEFEAWRLRELGRIKKEKEEELHREEEREEIERRRAMPEDQRLKEDLERAQKLREEKPKGQQKFLQKYWHKGAFRQDEEILKRHDFTEATESTVDVSMLPKVMQVKNFGKRSRTKYTHLLDQDTTVDSVVKAGGKSVETAGCFSCGGSHLKKDCPQNTGPLTQRGTGSNAAPTGPGRPRYDSNNSWRDGEGARLREDSGWKTNRSRDGERHERSNTYGSRSRSPPRRRPRDEEHSRSDRRRSQERSDDRGYRDKRRRIRFKYLVKVAVIGSGLAGLTASYLLTRQHDKNALQFEVHLFEKASSIGMDSSSVSLPVPKFEKEWRVDVPMRSFQGGYYRQLISLYNSLGVAFRKADFSYSFSLLTPQGKGQKRKITSTMIYNGASGRSGVSMPSALMPEHQLDKTSSLYSRLAARALATGVFVLLTAQLLLCYIRTLIYSIPIWRSTRVPTMTFREWADATMPKGTIAKWTGMDTAWIDYTQMILVPLFSAICTAPEADVIEHPVEEFLDYIWLTLGTHHYVVINGVRDVVTRLSSGLEHIHTSTPIIAIRPDADDSRLASIECAKLSGSEVHSGFHHIIFATQASSAVPLIRSYMQSLLPDATRQRSSVGELIQCLQSFTYRPTIVINHTDGTLVPDDTRDRRDLNLISLDWEARAKGDIHNDSELCVSSSHAMATHILPRPKGYPLNLPDVYQTTNPIIPPRKDSILSIAKLERAVVSMKSKEALKGLYREEGRKWWQCASQGQSRLGPLQGAGRLSGEGGPGIWICGSFAYAGIPLLEGCVVSARSVIEQGIFQSEGITPTSTPWN